MERIRRLRGESDGDDGGHNLFWMRHGLESADQTAGASEVTGSEARGLVDGEDAQRRRPLEQRRRRLADPALLAVVATFLGGGALSLRLPEFAT